jgi:hypothetical protein
VTVDVGKVLKTFVYIQVRIEPLGKQCSVAVGYFASLELNCFTAFRLLLQPFGLVLGLALPRSTTMNNRSRIACLSSNSSPISLRFPGQHSPHPPTLSTRLLPHFQNIPIQEFESCFLSKISGSVSC